ncbi:MAG: DEAD/DEAH box helicase, partial [Pirellulaceae bacterium]
MLTPADVLGPGQLIARRLEQYEDRPQQLNMADAVYDAITSGQHLVVEAATGVGKSLGYLVPAILAATEHQETGEEDDRSKRIVVSTHTISLQEQLINKDIPLVQSVLPREFSAILGKGRGNYISLRR